MEKSGKKTTEVKKVSFGLTTIIHIPVEDRSGMHWVLDRMRFDRRIKEFDRLFTTLLNK